MTNMTNMTNIISNMLCKRETTGKTACEAVERLIWHNRIHPNFVKMINDTVSLLKSLPFNIGIKISSAITQHEHISMKHVGKDELECYIAYNDPDGVPPLLYSANYDEVVDILADWEREYSEKAPTVFGRFMKYNLFKWDEPYQLSVKFIQARESESIN